MKLLRLLVAASLFTGCLPYKEKHDRRYRYESETSPVEYPDLSENNPDVRPFKEISELPWRIRKSKEICTATYTSDTSRKHDVILINKAAYNKRKKVFYILSGCGRDSSGENEHYCAVFLVSGRYLLSDGFSHLRHCETWPEIKPQLTQGNMGIFGGRYATKGEARRWMIKHKLRKFFGLNNK